MESVNARFVRTLSVQEERSEYPVLPVCKKASAFEADYEAISRTNGQKKVTRVAGLLRSMKKTRLRAVSTAIPSQADYLRAGFP